MAHNNRTYGDPGGGRSQYDIDFPDVQRNKRPRADIMNLEREVFIGFSIAEVNKSFKDYSIFDVNDSITRLAPNWKFISMNRERTLLIFSVKSERAAKALIEINSLKINNLDVPINLTWHPTLNTVKGIIYCREILDFTDEFIVQSLSAQNVTEVYRMTRRDGIHTKATGLFTVTFNAKSLPSSLKIAFLNVKVEAYFPNPMQCMHCLKLGHTKKGCKKLNEKAACLNCGSIDEHEECYEFCVNCKGNHSSKFRKCERFLAEKEIIKIKINKNISFPEARKLFEQQGGVCSYAEAAQKSELLSIVNQLKIDNKNLNKKLEEFTKLNTNLAKEMNIMKDKIAFHDIQESVIEKRLNLKISQLIAEKEASELTIKQLRKENTKLTKQQEQEEDEGEEEEEREEEEGKGKEKEIEEPRTHVEAITSIIEIHSRSSDESVLSEKDSGSEMEVEEQQNITKPIASKTTLMTDYLLPNNKIESPKEIHKNKPGRPRRVARGKTHK